jgi:hypothetical protein
MMVRNVILRSLLHSRGVPGRTPALAQFAVPFDEIAPIVGRSPEATRQLASRARRRVQGTGGVIVGPERKPFAVAGSKVAHDRIVAIDLIIDPAKLDSIMLER